MNLAVSLIWGISIRSPGMSDVSETPTKIVSLSLFFFLGVISSQWLDGSSP